MPFTNTDTSHPVPVRPVRIMIVDDQSVIREGLKTILATEPQFEVVGELESGELALEQVATLQPDIVLMDIHMPKMDGLVATRRLKERYPACEVLMLTSSEDQKYLRQALSAGASGYILKNSARRQMSRQALIDAVKTVANGGSLISPELLRSLIQEFANPAENSPTSPNGNGTEETTEPTVKPKARSTRRVTAPLPQTPSLTTKEYEAKLNLLTRRERQVLILIGQGLSNSLIAQTLTISQDTVKTHVRSILEKLELSDRTQAAVFAVRAQLT